jgi:hypothetical protein
MDFATILKLATDNEEKVTFVSRHSTLQHSIEFRRQVGVLSSTIRMYGSSGMYATTEHYKDFYWIDIDDYEEEDFKLGDINVDSISKLRDGLTNLGLSDLAKKINSDWNSLTKMMKQELSNHIDKEKIYKGKKCWNILPLEEKRLHWIKIIQQNPEVASIPFSELEWKVDGENMPVEQILEDYFKTGE